MTDSTLLKNFFIFSLGGLIGLLTTVQSWDGMIFFYINDQRKPAAIQKNFDFSDLKGSNLLQNSKERLISGAKILNKKEQVGIQLGNYLIKDKLGQKRFACNKYSNIEIEFIAVGILESGAPPTMKIKGPCLVSGDLNFISAIWVPYKKVMQEPAGDIELSFFDRQRIELNFTNIGTFWPKQWELHKIRLIGSQEKLQISNAEIRNLTSNPPEMAW